MNNHKSARSTVHGRELLVRRILAQDLYPREAALAGSATSRAAPGRLPVRSHAELLLDLFQGASARLWHPYQDEGGGKHTDRRVDPEGAGPADR